MGLTGSVEDLPLFEILQVVSFCQKTGHLTIRAPEGEAGVVFESGRVVSGYVWDMPSLPTAQFPAGPARELVVRERIVSVLERLVGLRTGEFAFNLAANMPNALGDRDLSGEVLPYGIDPEELMLDLARRLDEDRRQAAAAVEGSFAAPPDEDSPAAGAVEDDSCSAAPGKDDVVLDGLRLEDVPVARAPLGGPALLLVDDEPEIRRAVGERLSAAGYGVATAASPASARREMDRLASAGTPFLLVVDLGLPSDSGLSFRGGLEVARAASGLPAPPPVLLMAEMIDDKLRTRTRRLGVSLLAMKPSLSKLDPLQYETDLRAFADKLAQDLLPRLEGRRGHASTPAAPAPAPPTGSDQAARAAFLRSALQEMERRPDPDLIAILLLRAARAFLPRVLLFVVKDERLRGLYGFGPTAGGDSLDLLARDLSLPLDAPSAFSEAVASGHPWMGRIPADGPVRVLLERIGPLGVNAAAVLPVRAHRDAIAVLYGDGPDGAIIPPIGPLAEFVEHAGRTLGALFSRRQLPPTCARLMSDGSI